MRLDLILAALVLIAADAGGARADMGSPPVESPRFDGRDRAAIARDEVLSAIVGRDPWLVRRILDLGTAGDAESPASSGGADLGAPRDAASSVEWIALLKRARAERDALRPSTDGASRSAEGAVDIIDMMKKAKRVKAGE